VTTAADGRFSHGGSKIFFTYQLVAWSVFGRDRVSKIRSNKSADDITISHLCGNSTCCNGSHLFLESKTVNDERTHCHFVLNNLASTGGLFAVWTFKDKHHGWCPHNPECGDLRPEGVLTGASVQHHFNVQNQ
jgi:hypothetical protein